MGGREPSTPHPAPTEGAAAPAHGATGHPLRLVPAKEGSGRLAPEPEETLPTLDVLYERHWRYVARVASRLLGREDEVRDVVQDVFLAAMKGLPRVTNPAAIKGWLATITVRRVSDRLRLRTIRATLRLDDAHAERLPSRALGPEDMAALLGVYAALDRLPVKHRIAWTLRVVEEEPLPTVAQMCGCSLATAKRWIAAAQAALGALDDE